MPEGARKISAEVFVKADEARSTLRSVQDDVKGIGAEAQRIGGSASAALNGVASSANGSAAAFGSAGAAAKGFTSNSAAAGAEVRKLAAAWSEEATASARATTQATANTNAQRQATAAAAQTGQAVTQGGEAAKRATGFFGSLKDGLTQTTNQISSQGTAWQGYDRVATSVFGALLGPMGGLTVGWSLLITIGGSLIGKLFDLASAEESTVVISKATIEASAQRARAYLNEAEAAGILTRETELSVLARSKSISALAGQAVGLTGVTANDINKLEELRNKAAVATHELELLANEGRTNSHVAAQYRDILGDLNTRIDEQVKKLQPEIEAYITLTQTLGWSEKQLADFLIKHGAVPDQAVAVALAVRSESAAMRDAAGATQSWAAALAELVIAKRNLAATSEGQEVTREQLNKRIRDDIALSKTEHDIYLANESAIKAQVSAKENDIKVTAAQRGQKLTQQQLEREAINQLRQTGDETAKYITLHERVNGVVEKGAGHHRGAAAAARSYANALVDLRARAEEAEAALSLDSFSLQEFRIQRQIQKEREHLEINKKDKEAALRLLDRIERATLEKAHQDALTANDGFLKRQFDQHERHLSDVRKSEAQHHLKLLNQFIDRKKAEEGDDAARARLALAAQVNINEARLNEIHARAAIELDKVTRAYGRASESERIFALQLRSIEQLSQGDIFGGLITSIRAWNAELIQSGGYAQIWSDAIVGAFDAAFNQGGNFLEAFGKLLIAGLLKVYGQAAIASGTYHVAEGIARMATLWDFAGGAREFAAGTALIALGGAMVGAAGAIQNSIHRQPSATAGAATGAGSAAGGNQAGGSRPERQPTLIPFPTSGNSSDNRPIVIQLDRNLSKDLIEGKQVLTVPGIKGQQRAALKQVVKSMNSELR